jgi:hypothetical protein
MSLPPGQREIGSFPLSHLFDTIIVPYLPAWVVRGIYQHIRRLWMWALGGQNNLGPENPLSVLASNPLGEPHATRSESILAILWTPPGIDPIAIPARNLALQAAYYQ